MPVTLIRIIACAAAAATLVIMVLVSDFSEIHLVALFAAFAGFVNVPYILGWFAAGNLAHSRAGLAILGVAVICVAGLGLYAYWYTFFAERRTDAQDALVFAVLPVYQAGAVLIAWGVAALVAKWHTRCG